ncbi:GGDEF domain-containing protein [Vogesella sp. DC21W]|uniref:diguanylate cyclase n=1 Tax=Vogesella aquatica TaxID=2984206 RepID=A0ABT5J0H3_9NEIS|nr:GGDEF domain-containing protein [Vogesella aquatica]MDC7718333.1 GGDEF domain-containing protein [Vogesella aquatica]
MPNTLHTEHIQQLQTLYQGSELLVALFDASDTLRYANPAFRQAYHLAETAMPTWVQLMRDNHAEHTGTVIRTADFDTWLGSALSRRGKQAYRMLESDLHDGRWLMMTETVNEAGWMLCTAVDISSLAAGKRSLRTARDLALRAASSDALTGLSNRRHILAQLETQLARSGTHCVAILDIDFFKRINDSHGHPFGDLVLMDFARYLQNQLRRSDGIGRLGGEEFMLVLPDTPLAQASLLMHQLLSGLHPPRPIGALADFHYSCSGGLTLLQPGDSVQSAYHRADAALYRAKQHGRNRIELG